MGYTIILTADRGSFTDYSGSSVLGYVSCMPWNLVPRFLMDKFFTPPAKSSDDGRALFAPYALRKVEAALLASGLSEKEVAVIPPEKLNDFVDKETRVVAFTVHDPYGLQPVSFKLSMLFGNGETWNERFFQEFSSIVSGLKKKYGFVTIAGGPAAWQLAYERPRWLDSIFVGEAELDFPFVIKSILEGERPASSYIGRDAPVSKIPTIRNAARLGEVQITRGCPRGCQFCSITPETFRSIPVEKIIEEVKVNMSAGVKRVELITDDILLYGSNRLHVNHEAIVNLFSRIKELGVHGIYWPHISAPAVMESPKTIYSMREIACYTPTNGVAPVVGLETGSIRIFEKYMHAKAFPFKPEQWSDVILNATSVMNENYIYPCYTMVIGYQDETDEDVQDSIELVERLLSNNFKLWVFPLPLIPMGPSRLRNNPFPVMERLPSRYWELLYICWKHDLNAIRQLLPTLTSSIKNSLVRSIVRTIINRVTMSAEGAFRELMETRGKSSIKFMNINLNGISNLMRTISLVFSHSM